jgi:ubiquinone biosynthesis protein Coq4
LDQPGGGASPWTFYGRNLLMNAENLVKLLEEMIDLKIQQRAETNLKASPEVARILQEKRMTDRRRLEQIRVELVRALQA